MPRRLAWGVLLALIPALAAELLLAGGVYLPTLVPLFLAAVVLATLTAGGGAGMVSAAIGVLYYVHYALWYPATPPSSLAHTYARLVDLTVISFAFVPMILAAKRGMIAQARAQTIRQEAQRIAQRYEKLIQQLDAIIWEATPGQGGFLFVSQKAESMLGYPVQDWLSGGEKFLKKIIHPEDRQRVLDALRQPAHGEQEIDLEHRMVSADGQTRWVRNLVRVVADDHNAAGTRYGVIVDVTAQHQLEEALRISGARMRTLFDHASDAMFVFHVNAENHPRELVEANDAAIAMTGYSREQLLTMGHLPMAESPKALQGQIRHLTDGDSTLIETAIRAADGSAIPVESNVHLFELNHRPTVLSICRDIRERKRAERALRESEARERARATEIEAILSAVPAMVWITRDPQCQQLIGSRASYAFLSPSSPYPPNIPHDKLIATEAQKTLQPFNVFDPQGRAICIDQLPVQRAAREGVEVRNFEGQVRFEDGSSRYFFGNATPLHDESGQVSGAVGAFVDISARKRMMQELQAINQTLEQRIRERTAELAESQAQYKAMGDSVPFGVWMSDTQGQVQYFSQSFLDLLQMTMDQARGEGWMARLSPEDASAIRRHWRHCVTSGTDWEIEHHLRGPQGQSHTVLNRGKPVRDRQGTIVGWAGINLDITQRKAMEQQLRKLNETLQQRADQLRGLASELTQTEKRERRRIARVLHDDLQQILAAAKIRIGRLGQQIEHTSHGPAVAQISQLLDRSIDLSRSLTTELSPPQLHDGGLAAALEWIARWMDEHHQINIHLQIAPDAEPADPDVRELLFESVRELLFNSVKHARVSDVWVTLESVSSGVQVTVEDKGKGFDPQTMTQHRRGFGLLSIRERLLPFNGQLEIHSTPGRGTRMVLRVPRGRMPKTAMNAPLPEMPHEVHFSGKDQG